MSAVYAPYARGVQPDNLDSFYSDGLRSLFAKYRQQSEYGNGIGSGPDVAAAKEPDFDPFVDAKHYLMLDLTIGDPVINGDHAMVAVSYKNFDHPSSLMLSLLHTSEGWKIDDVASMGADQHWLLSWLLEYDPLGVH